MQKSPRRWDLNLNNRLFRGDFAIFQSNKLSFFVCDFSNNVLREAVSIFKNLLGYHKNNGNYRDFMI